MYPTKQSYSKQLEVYSKVEKNEDISVFTHLKKLKATGRFTFVFNLFVVLTVYFWFIFIELICPRDSIPKAKQFNYSKYKKWLKEGMK